MSSFKVNYSELVTALQDHEQGTANRLLKKLLPNLKTYLMAVMDASPHEAEEAVHQAFFNTYEKILDDEIEDKQFIFKYLIRACRNAYVRENQHDERYTTMNSARATPAEQIEKLLDEDRQRILRSCLQKLPDNSREFILYIFNHPGASTRSLSDYFGITSSNARVKKMRIIDDLSHCVKKKWTE